MKASSLARALSFAWLLLGAADGQAQDYPLVGNWEGSLSVNGLPVTSAATLRADGSFTVVGQSEPGLEFNLVGTYTVLRAQQTIRFVNRDWEPKEECLPGMDFQMHCTTLDVPPTLDAHYRFVSPDSVVVESPNLDVGPVQYMRMQ
jgi:hypothetical protein